MSTCWLLTHFTGELSASFTDVYNVYYTCAQKMRCVQTSEKRFIFVRIARFVEKSVKPLLAQLSIEERMVTNWRSQPTHNPNPCSPGARE